MCSIAVITAVATISVITISGSKSIIRPLTHLCEPLGVGTQLNSPIPNKPIRFAIAILGNASMKARFTEFIANISLTGSPPFSMSSLSNVYRYNPSVGIIVIASSKSAHRGIEIPIMLIAVSISMDNNWRT